MKKNLLLCFDAFGTLFVPKRLVHEQYVEVARRHGLTGLKSADVARSFEKGMSMNMDRSLISNLMFNRSLCQGTQSKSQLWTSYRHGRNEMVD